MRTNRRPERLRPALAAGSIVVTLLLGGDVFAQAGAEPARLEARLDGRTVALPQLSIDVDVQVQGDVATVRLTQVFENPTEVPIHARYVFPLPPDAAVHAMRMINGDRMIEAEIRRREEARAVYEAARERGNTAALTDQVRPNVFTQEVANLLPGLPVEVELEYAHAVAKTDGDYTLHVPLVVGPRYLAGAATGADDGAPTRLEGEPEAVDVGRWSLPASAPVAPPGRVDTERVGLRVRVDAGLPVQWLGSPSHALSVEPEGPTARTVTLAEGRTLDNRDFVLRYRLAGETVAAGATSSVVDGEGFVSLLIEPPSGPEAVALTPREVVFVLDCSGSMMGVPLSASKRFMRRMLPRLRPGDTFRIVRFSDSATEWSAAPVPATAANVQEGLRYVDQLAGAGGTVMTEGIRTALRPPADPAALRVVVFLTDGYIGNDVEIVRLLAHERGEARLFSFGVGTAVNRYLIQEMARVGRGAARIVLPSEDADQAADELAARLDAPVLTDVEIDWGDAPVFDVFPSEVPDLFLGQSVRVMARHEGGGLHRIRVRGRIAGRPVSLPLDLALGQVQGEGAGDRGGAALPILWARAQIQDRMIGYLDPARDHDDKAALREEVVDLALRHRLVTQWTSFVAVARPVVNPGGRGIQTDVPIPRVDGVSDRAYPADALLGGSGGRVPAPSMLVASRSFHGSSAPEPGLWVAAMAIFVVASLLHRRQWQATGGPGGHHE